MTFLSSRIIVDRIIMLVTICLICISCKKQVQEPLEQNAIDREKIDAVFDKNVSKVLLDHLYVVVDSVTYARLTKDNLWKAAYGRMDLGLPDFAPLNEQEHSSTCYLRGHQHYIEILGPNNKYNEPVGKSGIGFSLKNNNEHFHLGVVPKIRKTEDSLLYASETVDMPLKGDQHTWFKAFYTPSPGTALHTWYAFYDPAFLETLFEKSFDSYSRSAFLETAYTEQKLFNGIEEIHLSCIPEDYIRIARELRYLSCRLLERKGNVLTIAGGDVKIYITPSDEIEYSRITQLVCRLNGHDHSTTHLGNLTITNNDTQSVWDFDTLYENNP